MPSKAAQYGDDRDIPTVTSKSSGIEYLKNGLTPRQDTMAEDRVDSTLNDTESSEMKAGLS